jgi:hypothetical protein
MKDAPAIVDSAGWVEIFYTALVSQQHRAKSAARRADRSILGLHFRHFDDFSLGVVSGPLAHLLSILKIPRPHFGAVLPEPLPISSQHVVDGMTLRPDASVLMAVNSLLHAIPQVQAQIIIQRPDDGCPARLMAGSIPGVAENTPMKN